MFNQIARLKGAIWRLYLTALTVSITAFTICIYVDGSDAWGAWRRRQIVLKYYEKTRGTSDPLSNLATQSFKVGEAPWEKYRDVAQPGGQSGQVLPPEFDWDQYPPTREEKIAFIRSRGIERCLYSFLINASYPVDPQCQQLSLPNELTNQGIDKGTQIWPIYDIEMSLVSLILLITILTARYWLDWLFFGKRPNSFP
jgi:hypothetical protein